MTSLPSEGQLAEFEHRVHRRRIGMMSVAALAGVVSVVGLVTGLASSEVGLSLLGCLCVVGTGYLVALSMTALPGPDLDNVTADWHLVLVENVWSRRTLSLMLHVGMATCALIGYTQLRGDRGGLAPSRFHPVIWIVVAVIFLVAAIASDLGYGRVPTVVIDHDGVTAISPRKRRSLTWDQVRSIVLEPSQMNVVFTGDEQRLTVKVNLYRVSGSYLIDAVAELTGYDPGTQDESHR
ncbi:hypothetical protein GCM10023147_15600 [Tsukamurella soli]|uniref:PH domain-containing protein n=2 Tax=Tsukamurella soli TaxID=644556 RepID=A0ABP8JDN0_9ACTN